MVLQCILYWIYLTWINQCIYFSVKDNQSLSNLTFVYQNYNNFIMANCMGNLLRSIASTKLINFGLFYITLEVWSKIALGIRRKLVKHRWSRAGTKVFNWIHSIQKCIGNRFDINTKHPEGKGRGVQLNLLKHLASDKLVSFCKPTILKCAMVDACSICNKIQTFHQLVSDNKLDICHVTETWIKPDYKSTPSHLPSMNFSSHNTVINGYAMWQKHGSNQITRVHLHISPPWTFHLIIQL